MKIHFTPGEKWLYSGEGYEYLQSVATSLTGHLNPKACAQYEAGLQVCATDIDTYMKRTLLGPFGLSSSGYVWNEMFEKHANRTATMRYALVNLRNVTLAPTVFARITP